MVSRTRSPCDAILLAASALGIQCTAHNAPRSPHCARQKVIRSHSSHRASHGGVRRDEKSPARRTPTSATNNRTGPLAPRGARGSAAGAMEPKCVPQ